MTSRIKLDTLQHSDTNGSVLETADGVVAWSEGNTVVEMNRLDLRSLPPSAIDGQIVTTIDGKVSWSDPPSGGGGTATSLFDRAVEISEAPSNLTPVPGGMVTNLGAVIGEHSYRIADGPVVIGSGWVPSDWFNAVEDVESSWIVIKGDLTIDAGVIFTPEVRKLFMMVYVTGDLILNGQISMTRRGANHSGDLYSGGFTAPSDIYVKSGAIIPALGGEGGAWIQSDNATGRTGNALSGGSGGGGGGGTCWSSSYGPADAGGGAGAQGTCFSGGPGGGGSRAASHELGDAGPNGGFGGPTPGDYAAGGVGGSGAGNISPTSREPYGLTGASRPGENGTGGTLIVAVAGSISGSGSLTSAGGKGGNSTGDASAGGGSGGGIVLQMTDSITKAATSVSGGARGTSGYRGSGGIGGAGTARTVPLS